MEVLRRFVLAGAAILLVGCEFARAPTALDIPESSIGAYGVLRAGSDTVSVLLVRFRTDLKYLERGFDPISGADVRVISGNDTLRLAEAPAGFSRCYTTELDSPNVGASAGPGCYAATLPGGVQSGREYRLLARLPDGIMVEGVAAVPAAPGILAPQADARVPASEGEYTVRLVYTTPPGTGRVEVAVLSLDNACTIRFEDPTVRAGGGLQIGAAESNSVVVRINRVSCSERGRPVARDAVPARLVLTAYDTAYARYAAETLDRGSVLGSRASVGLTGALGLFAGAASSERRITFEFSR